jgi:hypothetical protein
MARWFIDAPLAWQALDELALANLFHKSNPKLNKLILRVIHRKNRGRGTMGRLAASASSRSALIKTEESIPATVEH